MYIVLHCMLDWGPYLPKSYMLYGGMGLLGDLYQRAKSLDYTAIHIFFYFDPMKSVIFMGVFLSVGICLIFSCFREDGTALLQ